MDFWTAVVIIVAIVTFAKLRRRHLRTDDWLPSGRFGGGAGFGSPREAELERELAQLRERIQVLERIATQERGTHDLAGQIEALRAL